MKQQAWESGGGRMQSNAAREEAAADGVWLGGPSVRTRATVAYWVGRGENLNWCGKSRARGERGVCLAVTASIESSLSAVLSDRR